MSEPGLCAAEEEPHLLAAHQWGEDPGRRDPGPQRAAVQEEGLPLHPPVHIVGAGEGSDRRAFLIQSGIPYEVNQSCIFRVHQLYMHRQWQAPLYRDWFCYAKELETGKEVPDLKETSRCLQQMFD